MKNRKNSCKSARYNGYNAMGQRCEVRTVKMNPDNALEQCMKIVEEDWSILWIGLRFLRKKFAGSKRSWID